ncbi:ubiquinol-cytochrome c reductase iron-sulfur subunit [Effusibacillus lacus]|uniref:(2Fe-2S)-binding protein n=1 Tax=Effusibacillus lacus TaxID=1348429 RepID=A0A292YJE5_9BACL|nr:Rieske 2Fe-2S domain-containing protein [Effusibacillus lacus]TCS76896.1 Rieske Fe-S protein [Effusibacillus lacus]GAX91227.1 (2Fe-2S)-binding protein [Effusibacillus lacus]
MIKRFEKYLRDISLNIRRETELDMNRRGFVAASLGLIAVFFLSSIPFVAQAYRKTVEEKPDRIKIAGPDELRVGDSKTFAYPNPNDPAILVRVSEKEYRSYHIKCTHLQCPIYWDKTSGKLMCPCHNGFFSVEDGSVLAGPPQRSLPSIKLSIKKDGIYAVGVIHGTHGGKTV